ncbi:ATP-binding protein [Streptomyces sp. NBC_01214]|uniref:ATP-binding protein n=1 Tax=Streptomyces sp. NBC_01214 TaxID=2903777 RepID=UPI002255D98B|nr:ATP-binding protein [Streptomyces sp. NBC_01214]MCX4801739.1 ATP-binding protein [Streptomyces sp. NBC_01214]
MPEPARLGSEHFARRLQAALEARGLDHIEPGPIDDSPDINEPGHPAYHQRRRAEWAIRRWEVATPYRYQDATSSHPAIQRWADAVVEDPRKAGFLLLTGPFGTGKTHEAYGALRRIADAGPYRYEVIAVTAPDMYALLRPGGSEKGAEYELKRLTNVPLLLIDDLGTEKISEFTEEATYRLLNERYNECRPLIITSNLPADSRDRDGNKQGPDLTSTLGERIVSRLRQMTTAVDMRGPDRRRGVA